MGTIGPYEPTWRETAASKLQDVFEALGFDRYKARRHAESITGGGRGVAGGMGLLDATPIGAMFGAQEGGLLAGEGAAQVGQGNALQGLLNMGIGSTAIFAGVGAKTAPKGALEKAKALAKSGVDERAIWRDTGWFKGGDGKWRFEISDDASKLTRASQYDDPSLLDPTVARMLGPNIKMRDLSKAEQADLIRAYGMPKRGYGATEDILDHPTLFQSYPDTAKEYTKVTIVPGIKYHGSYGKGIEMNAANEKDLHGGLLHELQHAIQQREGWARGGSPDMFYASRGTLYGDELTPEAKKILESALLDKSAPMSKDELAFRQAAAVQEAYRRLAGEAEARAVQKRMNMTPEQRRAVFPLDSYDVPIDELIFRIK